MARMEGMRREDDELWGRAPFFCHPGWNRWRGYRPLKKSTHNNSVHNTMHKLHKTQGTGTYNTLWIRSPPFDEFTGIMYILPQSPKNVERTIPKP